MNSELFELLKSEISAPLTLIDVGGHGGALENWKWFGDKARIFCFEARSDEAETLDATNTDGNIEYVPIGLSNDDKGIQVNVAEAAGCSSAFEPVENLYRRYAGCALMRPVARVPCATTTLDTFLAERNVNSVHGIKLDTQGFELRILQGAEKALEDCQFVLVETEFNPMYEGQPLFGDVDRFLRDRGFVLWRLQNLAHYATNQMSGAQAKMLIGSDPGVQQEIEVSNGQLFWADAFYVRKGATAVSDAPLRRELAIAGAALASQYDFNDLVLEMLRKSGDRPLLDRSSAILGETFVASAPAEFAADQFRSEQLVPEQGQWSTDFSLTDACIVYGPYVRLPYGEHEVTFHVEVEGLGDGPLQSTLHFQVAADMITLNSNDLNGPGGADMLRSGKVKVRFFNALPNGRFEFRLLTVGRPFKGKLIMRGVSLVGPV